MIHFQNKCRVKKLAAPKEPFPSHVGGNAIFNSSDFETFDKDFIEKLYREGQFGYNPTPRHAFVNSKDDNESFRLPSSLLFFPGLDSLAGPDEIILILLYFRRSILPPNLRQVLASFRCRWECHHIREFMDEALQLKRMFPVDFRRLLVPEK